MEGRAEGRAEGLEQKCISVIRNAQANNVDLEMIAKIADCDISFVEEICKLIAEYPELSDEEIAGIKNTNENAHMED